MTVPQHPTATPAITEAEHRARHFADVQRSMIEDHSPTGWSVGRIFDVLLAEYDRRGQVEQAAARFVMSGLCGTFDEDHDQSHSDALTALIAAVRTNRSFDA